MNNKRIELIKKIREAKKLNFLSERELKVLEYRFGIAEEKGLTLEKVGIIFGVTRERIRQIQDKALVEIDKRLDKKTDKS